MVTLDELQTIGKRAVVKRIQAEVNIRIKALVAEGYPSEQAKDIVVRRCRQVQTQDQVVEFLNERSN